MDNDEPFDLTGCNVYLRIAKADGTEFQGHECCTVNNSSITIDTSVGNGNQILTASGINKCELHIEDENGIRLTTWNFNIYVEARVHNGENISSINSYDVLDNMINMEKERIENEKKRSSNEIVRGENEGNRISNESERQQNELERQKTFGNVLDKAESYVSSASICAFNAKESEIESGKSEENAYNSALLAESHAHGKTGIRENEDSDNSEYWSRLSKSYKELSEMLLNSATNLLQEANKKIIELDLQVNDDFEVEYELNVYDFEINDNGELEYWINEGGNE